MEQQTGGQKPKADSFLFYFRKSLPILELLRQGRQGGSYGRHS